MYDDQDLQPQPIRSPRDVVFEGEPSVPLQCNVNTDTANVFRSLEVIEGISIPEQVNESLVYLKVIEDLVASRARMYRLYPDGTTGPFGT